MVLATSYKPTEDIRKRPSYQQIRVTTRTIRTGIEGHGFESWHQHWPVLFLKCGMKEKCWKLFLYMWHMYLMMNKWKNQISQSFERIGLNQLFTEIFSKMLKIPIPQFAWAMPRTRLKSCHLRWQLNHSLKNKQRLTIFTLNIQRDDGKKIKAQNVLGSNFSQFLWWFHRRQAHNNNDHITIMSNAQ